MRLYKRLEVMNRTLKILSLGLLFGLVMSWSLLRGQGGGMPEDEKQAGKGAPFYVRDYVSFQGMDAAQCKINLEYKGVTFYFTSDDNLKAFKKDKDTYFATAAADASYPMHQILKRCAAIGELLAGDNTQGVTELADDVKTWGASAAALSAALPKAEQNGFRTRLQAMTKAADKLAKTGKALPSAREAYRELSDAAIDYAKEFDKGQQMVALYVFHCPMAFKKKGADWLQLGAAAHNPYLGKEMPGCGTLQTSLLPTEVCDLKPEPKSVECQAEYQGITYYFCCERCVATFMADPEAVLARLRAPAKQGR